MVNWVDYFNDPLLVSRIQQYFGIAGVREKRKLSDSGISHNDNCIPKDSVTVLRANGISKQKDNEPEETFSSESDIESTDHVINNKFWYFLFLFGTELGDELFYATFIPFWFWNVDGAVGRRVVMVWAITMYVGQGIKDIICWPRPASPPVYRIQKKWVLEYGMPSTHAMVGVCIPFSVVLYTMSRYQYPVYVGWAIALLWCTVVSVSRLYLGMHSVLDVIAGLVLAVLLMIPVVPFVDYIDIHIVTGQWSPVILLVLTVSLIWFYPRCSNRWTPTRGDTTTILGVSAGVLIGAWTNYHLGQMSHPKEPPPYAIIWPSYEMMGLLLLRCAIGLSCVVATRAICKSACYATLKAVLSLESHELKNTESSKPSSAKNTIELTYTYITYSLIGFNIIYLLPTVFTMLRIDRPTFYTEL